VGTKLLQVGLCSLWSTMGDRVTVPIPCSRRAFVNTDLVRKRMLDMLAGDLTKSAYMYIHLICELRRLKRNP
jgi:hypothetical protein